MDVEGLGDPGQEKNAKAFFDPGKKEGGGKSVISALESINVPWK